MAKILIVDDRASNRVFLAGVLRTQGHHLLEASDGAEALEQVRKERPTLVISDILMPTMDGYEFVRRLRMDAAISKTPVIFHTAAYLMEQAQTLARDCGVSAVLLKPSEPEAIIRLVNRALGAEASPPAPFSDSDASIQPESLGVFSDTISERIHGARMFNQRMAETVDGNERLGDDREHLKRISAQLGESLLSVQAVSLRMSALIEVGLESASQRDPGQLLEGFCDSAREIMSAKYAGLAVLEDDSQSFRYLMMRGIDSQARELLRSMKPEEGLLGRIMAERRPKRMGNPQGNPEAIGLPVAHPPVHSFLGVPIASSMQVYGWLYVGDKLGADGFSEIDEKVAVTLAAQAAIAYGNVRLYDEIQRHATQLQLQMAERRRAEEQIGEQAKLLNLAQDAIVVHDLEHRIQFWNKGAERLYGWTTAEAVGHAPQKLVQFEEGVFEKAMAELFERGEWNGELKQIARDNKQVVVNGRWTLVRDALGKPKSVLVINSDITEKKRLETQFFRAQRMESIGALASGIAHDLNNVLSPVMMGIQILKKRVKDDRCQEILDTLATGVRRGADIVRQILSFGRGIEAKPGMITLGQVILEIEKILRETFPKSIEIVHEIDNDLRSVMGDITQLHQLLMNLCVNARDAMPNGGTLTIRAQNVTVDDSNIRKHGRAKPGCYALIVVSDTGVGIPAEMIPCIFDPFFTTKEIGKGTGLGLSTAMSIVKNHGGVIDVGSEVGAGARFRVYLPVACGSAAVSGEKGARGFPPGHGEWILLVDDEASIREITRGTLENYGYHVIMASNGVEAVSTYVQHRKNVQLVLMDWTMPYMDGQAAIRALRRISPKLKMIATSGSNIDRKSKRVDESDVGRGRLVQAVLYKPYTAEKLLTALHELLHPKTEG